MPSAKPAQDSITDMLNIPQEARWIDLSAYSMALKLAVYKDGKAMLVDGGDHAPEALTALGFRKVDGEWLSGNYGLLPRAVKDALPESFVRVTPTYETVVDRRDQNLPDALATSGNQFGHAAVKFNQRVASAVASAPDADLTTRPTFWFAHADLLDQDVHGFGSTPESAMEALVSAWKDIADREHLDVGMLSEYRDSISVVAAEMGKGYAKGAGDRGWYQEALLGSNERFERLFDDAAKPAPKRGGPKL